MEKGKTMRLIDADALLKHKTDHDMINTHLIYNAPTVDAVPVRHGKWIIDPHSQYGFPLHIYLKRKCSECSHSVDNPTPYCPWCGAKMDGERKEEK